MSKQDRKEELLRAFAGVDGAKELITPLLDDVVFLESRLEELRRLPFIEVSSKSSTKQRATAAAKQYKELLQQYNNCIKILAGILRKDGAEEISPLREWVNNNVKKMESR